MATPHLLDRFPKVKGWRAQVKLNGDRCLVIRTEDGEVQFWTRHGRPFQRFHPPRWMVDVLLEQLPPATIVDGELLHFRTKDTKNNLALFDVIAWRGRLLLDEPQAKRWARLWCLDLPKRLYVATSDVVYVQRPAVDPRRLFWASLQLPPELSEGIVVKSRRSPLRVGLGSAPTAVGWYKVRRPKSRLYLV